VYYRTYSLPIGGSTDKRSALAGLHKTLSQQIGDQKRRISEVDRLQQENQLREEGETGPYSRRLNINDMDMDPHVPQPAERIHFGDSTDHRIIHENASELQILNPAYTPSDVLNASGVTATSDILSPNSAYKKQLAQGPRGSRLQQYESLKKSEADSRASVNLLDSVAVRSLSDQAAARDDYVVL
jgi:hypothetical protein